MRESARMDIPSQAPEAYRKLAQIDAAVAGRIDRKLLHLIKLRASQINGCAYCLAMHTHHALEDGETVQRLMQLDAWEESPSFDERERAVLAWVEEITLIAGSGVSDEAHEGLREHFSEEEIAWLTLAAIMINSWNRLAIASKTQCNARLFAEVGGEVAEEMV